MNVMKRQPTPGMWHYSGITTCSKPTLIQMHFIERLLNEYLELNSARLRYIKTLVAQPSRKHMK